jgi:hypothetical protein
MGIDVADEMLAKLSIHFLGGSCVTEGRSECLLFPFLALAGI